MAKKPKRTKSGKKEKKSDGAVAGKDKIQDSVPDEIVYDEIIMDEEASTIDGTFGEDTMTLKKSKDGSTRRSEASGGGAMQQIDKAVENITDHANTSEPRQIRVAMSVSSAASSLSSHLDEADNANSKKPAAAPPAPRRTSGSLHRRMSGSSHSRMSGSSAGLTPRPPGKETYEPNDQAESSKPYNGIALSPAASLTRAGSSKKSMTATGMNPTPEKQAKEPAFGDNISASPDASAALTSSLSGAVSSRRRVAAPAAPAEWPRNGTLPSSNRSTSLSSSSSSSIQGSGSSQRRVAPPPAAVQKNITAEEQAEAPQPHRVSSSTRKSAVVSSSHLPHDGSSRRRLAATAAVQANSATEEHFEVRQPSRVTPSPRQSAVISSSFRQDGSSRTRIAAASALTAAQIANAERGQREVRQTGVLPTPGQSAAVSSSLRRSSQRRSAAPAMYTSSVRLTSVEGQEAVPDDGMGASSLVQSALMWSSIDSAPEQVVPRADADKHSMELVDYEFARELAMEGAMEHSEASRRLGMEATQHTSNVMRSSENMQQSPVVPTDLPSAEARTMQNDRDDKVRKRKWLVPGWVAVICALLIVAAIFGITFGLVFGLDGDGSSPGGVRVDTSAPPNSTTMPTMPKTQTPSTLSPTAAMTDAPSAAVTTSAPAPTAETAAPSTGPPTITASTPAPAASTPAPTASTPAPTTLVANPTTAPVPATPIPTVGVTTASPTAATTIPPTNPVLVPDPTTDAPITAAASAWPTSMPTSAPTPMTTEASSVPIVEVTTTFSPFVRGDCNFSGEIQPNVLSQCDCTGEISVVANDIMLRYMELLDFFVPMVYDDFSEIPSSCAPSNQALLWLASADGNNGDLQQRFSLAVVYYSWNGPNWLDQSSWLSSAVECDWTGVSCIDGIIVGIDLGNNRAVGLLVSELGILTRLQTFNIAFNGIVGQLPVELFSIATLTSLTMNNNGVQGPLPTEIGGLINLETLRLNNNNILSEIPTEIGNAVSLKQLNLGSNFFQMSIPSEIGQLVELVRLRLDSNLMTGPLPDIGNLTNLEFFDISNNNFQATFPQQYGSLTSLVTLRMRGSGVGGRLPPEIGMLQSLEQFLASGAKFRQELATELILLPNLTVLELDNNQLSGKIPSEIGMASGLVTLSLHNNNLEGSVVSELGNLVNLESLTLEGNDMLTGRAPDEVCDLRSGVLSIFTTNCPAANVGVICPCCSSCV